MVTLPLLFSMVLEVLANTPRLWTSPPPPQPITKSSRANRIKTKLLLLGDDMLIYIVNPLESRGIELKLQQDNWRLCPAYETQKVLF